MLIREKEYSASLLDTYPRFLFASLFQVACAQKRFQMALNLCSNDCVSFFKFCAFGFHNLLICRPGAYHVSYLNAIKNETTEASVIWAECYWGTENDFLFLIIWDRAFRNFEKEARKWKCLCICVYLTLQCCQKHIFCKFQCSKRTGRRRFDTNMNDICAWAAIDIEKDFFKDSEKQYDFSLKIPLDPRYISHWAVKCVYPVFQTHHNLIPSEREDTFEVCSQLKFSWNVAEVGLPLLKLKRHEFLFQSIREPLGVS